MSLSSRTECASDMMYAFLQDHPSAAVSEIKEFFIRNGLDSVFNAYEVKWKDGDKSREWQWLSGKREPSETFRRIAGMIKGEDMTVEEAQIKRHELEQGISVLMAEFKASTGLNISDITMNYPDQTPSVTVTVKI